MIDVRKEDVDSRAWMVEAGERKRCLYALRSFCLCSKQEIAATSHLYSNF